MGLGIVGGFTPMLASWLILRTGLEVVPAGLLGGAAALVIVGLVWMTDRSREPLRTSCAVPLHHASSPHHPIPYGDRMGESHPG